jgi:uncharacterized membrane protein SirB2
MLISAYPAVKTAHVTAVAASGTLFLFRGLAAQLGARWPFSPPVRYLSYLVDTALLVAGAALVSILPPAVFANGWLAVKLALVVLYIILGVLALKRARTPLGRRRCFAAALVTFALIATIAVAHSPLGPLAWLLH